MRQNLTRILVVALIASCAFSGWMWFRPYELSPDPAARFRIDQASLRRDQSYFWLDLHLKRSGSTPHDLSKPIRLACSSGRIIEPADVTLVSDGPEEQCNEIGLRFWIEARDINGTMDLRINGGALHVKSNPGIPNIPEGNVISLSSHHW